jgi:tetratricopeptide (TPR) repeat protein
MRLSFKILMSVAISVFASGMLLTKAALAEPVVTQNAQANPEALKKEIEKLKNEKEFEAKRVEEMRQEREDFVKEIRRVENLNTKYTKEIESLRSQMDQQQQAFEDRMKKMEDNVKESLEAKAKRAEPEPVQASAIPPMEVEKKANEILMKGGDLDPEDQKFKEELARAHYNMGNVYFERGEYQRAVVEYYQAADLMPYDADAHYNLAFVSGEFIGDQETALKHYQWYLYLKPGAEDRKVVEEKIVAAKLTIRGRVGDSKVDMPDITGQQNIAR